MNPYGNSDITANTENDLASRDWDDVIDFRTTIFVLIAWWREIVLGVFLAAIMGGAVIAALGAVLPRYEASISVVPIYDTTRSEYNPDGQTSALLGIVHHEFVAKRVLERLRLDGSLEDERYTADMLLKAISAKQGVAAHHARGNQGNLIRIDAEADSPKKAAAIVSAWAEEYVIEMNRLYAQEPSATIDEIRLEIDRATDSLEDAQRGLEQMGKRNNIDRLKRQIQRNRRNIRKLHDIRNRIVAALLDRHVDSQFDLLDQYYDIRLRLNELLGVAESLRAQIEGGSEAGAASNELAIMLFKVHAYTVTGDLPNKLEIDFGNTRTAHANVADQSADMDAVIAALRDRIDRVNQDIARQSHSLSTRLLNIGEAEGGDLPIQSREEKAQGAPDFSSRSLLRLPEPKDYSDMDEGSFMRHLEDMEDRTRLLEVQLEAERFNKNRLEQVRNRRHSYLEDLRSEYDKMALQSTIGRPLLRLESSIATEGESLWPSPVLVAAVGGVAGLLVIVLFVFSANALGVQPFLGKPRAGSSVPATSATRSAPSQ